MARFLPRLLGRHLLAAYRDIFFKPQWFLALRRGSQAGPFRFSGFTPLYPPKTQGWADPFPFVHDGRLYLFIEEIDQATGLGSLAVMTLDLRTGHACYGNAGHPAPLHIATDGTITPLPLRGTIIGLEGFQPFPSGTVTFAPGDKLVTISDGLPDRLDASGKFFGDTRVLDVLRANHTLPIGELLASLRQAAEDFCAGTPPRDDVSILGLEYVHPKPL